MVVDQCSSRRARTGSILERTGPVLEPPANDAESSWTGPVHFVTSDGGYRQSNDADLTASGVLEKAAQKATGGNATGVTSLKRIP